MKLQAHLHTDEHVSETALLYCITAPIYEPELKSHIVHSSMGNGGAIDAITDTDNTVN